MSETGQKPQAASSRGIGALLGAVVGLVVGIAVDGGVWLVTFGRALNGAAGVHVPLIVSTALEDGEVTARSGIGILVLPLACALLGCLVGLALARRHGPRRRG